MFSEYQRGWSPPKPPMTADGSCRAKLVGTALAPAFLNDPELPHRMRIIAFTILTPFYFLKAGSLVDFHALVATAGLIAVFLAIKMATKFAGILPLTKVFRFEPKEGMYTTLLLSTGLTPDDAGA
jgi:Kef-type K+ transport system membrane component KefB